MYAEAANDWVQAVKQRAADKGLQFNVLLQVITALTSHRRISERSIDEGEELSKAWPLQASDSTRRQP